MLFFFPDFHSIEAPRLFKRRFLTGCQFSEFSYISTAHNHGMNTTQCHSCLEDDFDLCVNESEVQNCTSPATDSCYSGAGRIKFTNGSKGVFPGVARGCIACSGKIMFV